VTRKAERRRILSELEGKSDAEVIPRLHELLLYRDANARRKARELSWYLVSLRPLGVEEHRRLAEVLSTHEEVIARLAVLERTRRLAPSDERLLGMVEEAKQFLGWREIRQRGERGS
jgi:hypothetical protein